ncbi:ArnT family glycosyltransferase [Haliovirga abyssi]|uniref:Glycosyltransferase RgtA/B/C/D-like domain-containing protein n=1 Tax=Haliovirga abyssi TaxID=2996794 RepID=A0AAU9D562_9FUSO|nr:hypothetical protein [Haliovirga abyssi]BDU51109.1 hypothetical protein HLVA_16780 [Haliovirga abyssi]
MKKLDVIYKKQWIALAVIFLIGLIAYSTSFMGSFHFDDYSSIIYNYEIKNLWSAFLDIFRKSFSSRRLVYFTFAINYKLGGLNPIGYHIVNFIIHFFSALFVYLISKNIISKTKLKTYKDEISFFISAIFIAHPITTQAVTYVTQRLESMASMFFLGSFYFYLRYRDTIKIKYVIYSAIMIILGSRCKEIVVTLGGIILIYEIIFGNIKKLKKKDIGLFLLISSLALIPFWIRVYKAVSVDKVQIIKTFDLRQEHKKSMTREDYLRTEMNVVRTYLRLMILPIRQSLDYDYKIQKNMDLITWLSLVLHIGLILIAIYNIKKNKFYAFGILWFYVVLIPTSTIIPIEDVIYEHRVYLPSVGFIFAFVGTLYYLIDKFNNKVEDKK